MTDTATATTLHQPSSEPAGSASEKLLTLPELCRSIRADFVHQDFGHYRCTDICSLTGVSTGAVQDWFERAQPRIPGFGMVREGQVAELADVSRTSMIRGVAVDGIPDVKKISGLFSDGYTLVLTSMDAWSAPFADFRAEFGALLRGRIVRPTCFVSPANGRGFPEHSDDDDLIIIQLEGTKQWRVRHHDRLIEMTLRRGDVLYLPPGTPHQAIGTDTGSLHVTVGFHLDELPLAVARVYQTVIAQALRHFSTGIEWTAEDLEQALATVAHEALKVTEPMAYYTDMARAEPRRTVVFHEPLISLLSLDDNL